MPNGEHENIPTQEVLPPLCEKYITQAVDQVIKFSQDQFGDPDVTGIIREVIESYSSGGIENLLNVIRSHEDLDVVTRRTLNSFKDTWIGVAKNKIPYHFRIFLTQALFQLIKELPQASNQQIAQYTIAVLRSTLKHEDIEKKFIELAKQHENITSKSEPVPVHKVNADEFNQLKQELGSRHAPSMNTGEWVNTSRQQEILNYGAWPCLIIYVFYGEKLLVGHFPFANPTSFDNYQMQGMASLKTRVKNHPQKEGTLIERFSKQTPVSERELNQFMMEEMQSYLEFRSKLRQVSKISQGQLEVYLFGQNDPLGIRDMLRSAFVPHQRKLQVLVESYQDYFSIMQELRKLGVSLENIHDFRTIIGDKNKGDNTLYIPDQGIYHYEEPTNS